MAQALADEDLGISRSYKVGEDYHYLRIRCVGLRFYVAGPNVPRKDTYSAMVVARRLQSSSSLDTSFMRNSEQRCRLLARLRLQRLQGQETSFLYLLQTFRVT